MKIAIIYHKSDYDGILSNEVCRHWLTLQFPSAGIESFGWNYGEPLPGTTTPWEYFDAIYIVDLSVDELMEREDLREKIIWIDHHKSAIEKWDSVAEIGDRPTPYFIGYRIDGVAACRLCWQWFYVKQLNLNQGAALQFRFPIKPHFIDRQVEEPTLIRLAGEYDVWDHRDPNAAIIQLGLRAITQDEFNTLLHYQFCGESRAVDLIYLTPVIEKGRVIQHYSDQQSKSHMQAAFVAHWNGIKWLCLNGRGNSLTFTSRIDEVKPDALMMFYFDGAKTRISLYHAPGQEHYDLSVIAKAFGGGGHRGACGFELPGLQLPRHLFAP